jgi:hypothetical protein
VTTVNAAIEELAARLRELEKENGTSRRRVRELELELDVCRAEVVKERTRAKEEIMKSEKARIKERDQFDRKGKGKATGEGIDWEARYHEVVEEKKGPLYLTCIQKLLTHSLIRQLWKLSLKPFVHI